MGGNPCAGKVAEDGEDGVIQQHLLMRLIFWSLFAGVLAGCATLGGNEEGATPVS